MTIGERIKQQREQQYIQQADLAARVGITKQLLYKYENGIITNIPSDKIEALADVLGVHPAFLTGWVEDPHYEHGFSERLTTDERTLVHGFRKASTDTRMAMLTMAKAALNVTAPLSDTQQTQRSA